MEMRRRVSGSDFVVTQTLYRQGDMYSGIQKNIKETLTKKVDRKIGELIIINDMMVGKDFIPKDQSFLEVLRKVLSTYHLDDTKSDRPVTQSKLRSFSIHKAHISSCR